MQEARLEANMISRMFIAILTAVLLVSSVNANGQARSVKMCVVQSKAFAVDCPSHWHLLPANDSIIDLLSFPPSERLEGTTIKDGGAEITIESMQSDTSGVDAWIASDKKLVNSSKSVHSPLPGVSFVTCRNPQILDSEIEMGPSEIEHDLSIYCTGGQNSYRFRLRAWKGDPQWAIYENTFKRVVNSFRELH